MLAQPEKVMTASQKKLKTQREQYHVMYQGKGRFEHSQFFVVKYQIKSVLKINVKE